MRISKKRLRENKTIAVQIGISVLALGLSTLFLWWTEEAKVPVKAEEVIIATTTPDKTVFESLQTEAKSLVVYDPTKGEVIYGRRERESLPLASLTKLMTAAVASDILTPTSTIIIGEKSLREEGDTGLSQGERWNFPELLNVMLVASSNDGAAAIASAANSLSSTSFTSLMNKKARDLGLTNSNYSSATGLDINDSIPSAQGSALDVAKLMAYILKTKPEILEATRYSVWQERSLDQKVHQVKNTNEVTTYLPGLVASKTGYTQSSGGNLAVTVDVGLNQPLILVVMGSSKEGRFSDMQKLLDASLEYSRQNS